MSIHIQTRQQPNLRKWWCHGTVNGYDESFEGFTIGEAQAQMRERLIRRTVNVDDVIWCNPEYYKANQAISRMYLIAQTTRLTQ